MDENICDARAEETIIPFSNVILNEKKININQYIDQLTVAKTYANEYLLVVVEYTFLWSACNTRSNLWPVWKIKSIKCFW